MRAFGLLVWPHVPHRQDAGFGSRRIENVAEERHKVVSTNGITMVDRLVRS